MGLAFGYDIPEGTEVAWGARIIVSQAGSVDFLNDRQSVLAPDEEAWTAFADRLGALMPLGTLRNVISSKLRSGEINTREGREVVIIEDDGIRIVGSSRGSAGYFYVSAYPI